MQTEFYLLLSAALIGIGVGSAISRRNVISIIMSIVTTGLGTLLAMATFDRYGAAQTDGMLFAICLGAVLLMLIVLGCSLAYRRFMTSGDINIDDENNLRH